MHFRSIYIGALFVATLAANTAFASGICYEDVEVPPSLGCASSNSISADFTSGCSYNGPTTERRVVPCAEKWVEAVGNTPTHVNTCSRVGLSPTNINGDICASGTMRPAAGSNAASINYKYGKQGSLGSGGTIVVNRLAGGMRNGAGDGDDARGQKLLAFCERPGQRSSTASVSRVVAFACR
jgi:hypothetical protein